MSMIHFQLVTPERTVLSEELTSLSCPTQMGQITILPNHAPLVAALSSGELQAKTETGDSFIFVAGGFVEVRANNEVVVLADAAEHHYEIDIEKAEAAKKKAEDDMKQHRMSNEEYAKVAAALEHSLARMKIARKHAHRKNPLVSQGNLTD